MVSFIVPQDDLKKIVQVVEKYIECSDQGWSMDDRLNMIMSLTACHANGTKLDLEGLLKASPIDLSHDVQGVCQNINTNTGKLDNCFLPRYTQGGGGKWLIRS